jgi:SAM-dependent methyltransferase
VSRDVRARARGFLRTIHRTVRPLQPHPDLVKLTPEDRRYLTTLHDESVPLPEEAERRLRGDDPRLVDLRRRYAALDLPVLESSRWNRDAVEDFLDLRFFRGETLITWHYRELRRISELKYFVFARYVAERDRLGLLERLKEDGAFGCWTFSYPGYGTFSRDLLESVNEISFIERNVGTGLRVLDIGAGYGRLAQRFAEADGGLVEDYCCVDAVPESTFVSEFYLRFRGASPPARVLALDEVEATLEPGGFDLAVNVHSFPEVPFAAIEWWIRLIARLEIPRILIVPNEPTELLSLEADGSRRDFAPLLADAGYRLARREPVIDDPAVRSLVRLDDHFHLYERSTG